MCLKPHSSMHLYVITAAYVKLLCALMQPLTFSLSREKHQKTNKKGLLPNIHFDNIGKFLDRKSFYSYFAVSVLLSIKRRTTLISLPFRDTA